MMRSLEYRKKKVIWDKKYAETHKEELRVYYKENYKKNKDKYNEARRKHRELNGDEIRQREIDYKDRNREKVREWSRNFYYKNKGKRTALIKEYHDKNKEKYKVIRHNYKVKRKLKILDGDKLKTDLINELLMQQNNSCYYCKNKFEDFHIDHLIPLAKGGGHKEYNIVLACPKCNIKKSAKMPDEFIKSIAI